MYKAFSPGHYGFQKSLEESVAAAVKYGYQGVGIDIAGLFNQDPLAIKALLAENGLKPGGFGLPVNYRESQEAFDADMEKLPAYCDFAAKLGDFRCMTWIFPSHDTLDYKANFELHKTRMTQIAKVLEAYGIRFGIEFVGPPRERKSKRYAFIHNLDGLMELWDAIGTTNLGVILDAWHWDLAGQTFEDFQKIPGQEWVVMAHINDAPAGIPIDEQRDLCRELPGATGILRIDAFFKGLTDMQYDGPVYAEPFYAPLKTMAFEDAVALVTRAIDKVWPR